MKSEAEGGGRAVARVNPRWDAARTELSLAALHRRRARRRATSVLLAGVAVAAIAVLGWTTRIDAPAPRTVASGERERVLDPVVHLADGSRVTPDEGASVVVDHVSDDRIEVRIDRGAAAVEVVPGLARRFEVRAGEVTIRVIGTGFRVELLDDGHVFVSVEHGHVEVHWAAGSADLLAGEDGVFPAPEVASPPTTAFAVHTAEAPPTAPREVRVRRAEDLGAPSPIERPGWRSLAQSSRYDDAYEALGPAGQRTAVIGDDVEDLLLAADVARLSGHPSEALPWLAAVEHDHGSDPRAVLATFTRGRLLMDLGRPADAADAFERALAMEPRGSIAEDALARAALASAAAGQMDRAAGLADRYLEAHPSGRWGSRVRGLATVGPTGGR